MKKAIVLLEANLEIGNLVHRIEALNKQAQDQVEFMNARLKKMSEELNTKCIDLWKEIEEKCKEQNLLPENYSKKTHYMQFGEGVLYLGDKDSQEKESGSFKDLLQRILKDT